MMGTLNKVIKVPFKTNNSFNSTMMASFLPVIVSKKRAVILKIYYMPNGLI